MNDLINRNVAIDVLVALEEHAPTSRHLSAIFDCEDAIKHLPSVQDTKITKISSLVEGTIDHFDLDDAMDLLYQIKEIACS